MLQDPVRLPPPALTEPPSSADIPQSLVEFLEKSPIWVIYDLEWTTWEGALQRMWTGEDEELEVVQFGACKLDAKDAFKEIDIFTTLVRPALSPMVSDYFTNLTGIAQADIDSQAISFPEAFQAFLEFAGLDCPLLSWGLFQDLASPEPQVVAGDLLVLERNCHIHGLTPPSRLRGIDAKSVLLSSGCEEVQRLNSGRAWQVCGKDGADEMASLGGAAVGEGAHDALWDARSISCALRAYARTKSLVGHVPVSSKP